VHGCASKRLRARLGLRRMFARVSGSGNMDSAPDLLLWRGDLRTVAASVSPAQGDQSDLGRTPDRISTGQLREQLAHGGTVEIAATPCRPGLSRRPSFRLPRPLRASPGSRSDRARPPNCRPPPARAVQPGRQPAAA
jgi:hypothetical protein